MRTITAGTIATVVVLTMVHPTVAQERGDATDLAGISARDSVDLLRAAKSDQASFERFRRRSLPLTWGGGSSRCDERVGRFCLNHMSGAPTWVAPPEDERVVEARLNFVEALGQVAELIPGDAWIAGQRVRYLVEARRFDEALAAAADCRADLWWCHALAGFAHHNASNPASADSAFARALDAMEPERRERWTDLTLILDERTVRSYRRMEGETRAAFENRFWRLADPLLTQPGNEIRNEHFARHVWDELQQDAESPDGLTWGWDLREITIRYGWPSGFEQTRTFGIDPYSTRPPVVSHFSSSPRPLLPPAEALLGETAADGEWEADVERSRTGYNFPFQDSVARWFLPLPSQLAVFHRGDSTFVAAAFELLPDSIPPGARVDAGIALLPTTTDSEPVIVLSSDTSATGAMLIVAPAEPVLMTLEVLVPSERRIGRARHGLDLSPLSAGRIALSDLLLLSGDAELPDSLPDAVRLARGSNRIHSGDRLAVYWETYGVDAAESGSVTMSLQLVRARVGWLRRLGERAGILSEVAPVRLQWEEPVTDGPFMPRSIHIDIPDIDPGEYILELSVEVPGRESLRVRKEIDVVG